MNIVRRLGILGTVALLAALAAGCGRDVNVYEPGVYKGAKDPLVAKQASPEQQARLKERVQMAESDR